MATKTKASSGTHQSKPRKKRKGIHAKTKSSKTKACKNYKKANVGQGR